MVLAGKKYSIAIAISSLLILLAAVLWNLENSSLQLIAPWIYFGCLSLLLLINIRLINISLTNISKYEWLGLGLVIIIAIFFRTNYLTTFPYGAWYDEAQNTIVSRNIIADPSYRPVYVSDLSQLTGFSFYVAIPFVQMFPEGVLGYRVLAAIVGILAVIATWLLTRSIFNPLTAFIAAFLVAISRWHATFSRLGMVQISTTLFVPLVLWALISATKKKSVPYACLAGLLLGIGAQGYYPALAIAGVSGLSFLVFQQFRSGYGLKLIPYFIVSTVLALSPVIYFASTHFEIYTERFRNVSEGGLPDLIKYATSPTDENYEKVKPIVESAIKHIKMFNLIGDSNGRHNMPGYPMFDEITGIAVIIGFCIFLYNVFQPQYFAVLVAVTVSLAGGILSLPFEAPQAGRTVANSALLAVFAACALAWPAIKMKSFRQMPRTCYAVFLGLLLVFCTLLNWHYFFDIQRNDDSAWASYSIPETIIARISQDVPANIPIYAPENWSAGPTISLMASAPDRIKGIAIGNSFPLNCQMQGLVFILGSDRPDLISNIQSNYLLAKIESVEAPSGKDAFFKISLGKDTFQSSCGWQLINSELNSEEIIYDSSFITPKVKEGVFNYALKGGLNNPKYGNYYFRLEGADEITSFKIDGFPLTQVENSFQIKSLAIGLHRIEISFKTAAERSVKVLVSGNAIFQPLPKAEMFRNTELRGGLLAEYFKGIGSQRILRFRAIEADIDRYFHIAPVPRPFSVRWSGRVKVKERGDYLFRLLARDKMTLWLDGHKIYSNEVPGEGISEPVNLDARTYDLIVEFEAETGYFESRLYWKKPLGDKFEIIDQSNFLEIGLIEK